MRFDSSWTVVDELKYQGAAKAVAELAERRQAAMAAHREAIEAWAESAFGRGLEDEAFTVGFIVNTLMAYGGALKELL